MTWLFRVAAVLLVAAGVGYIYRDELMLKGVGK
jgi:hypothetical protein